MDSRVWSDSPLASRWADPGWRGHYDDVMPGDRIDVSVVVPVYNPGSYIEPCIASLLAQTHPADRLELIFVDDGSTDGTPALLDRLAREHRHVKVIHRPNSGWSGQPRNDGIAFARAS